MIFRRHKEEPLEDRTWECLKMLQLSQQNTLALANLTLTIVEDPECVTSQTRDQLIEMIRELEFGIAHFEEYIL